MASENFDIQTLPACDDDRDWLEQLRREVYEDLFEATFGGWDEARHLRQFERCWERGDIFIIQVEGRAVGMLQLFERPDAFEIGELQIQPQDQGVGLGTAVLKSVLTRARTQSKAVKLSVGLKNDGAYQLYLRLGFQLVATTETHHQLSFPLAAHTGHAGQKTARQVKAPLSEWDLSCLPVWTPEQLEQGFRAVRGDYFLPDPDNPALRRKIPWRFVENGCFVRAALSRRHLYSLGFPPIKKIFIFGQMAFPTLYSLTGQMTYKDHVAIGVRVGEQAFVLDPSLCEEQALRLEEWEQSLFALSSEPQAEFSLCSEFTMGHNSAWDESEPEHEVAIRKTGIVTLAELAQEFLRKESELLKQLNLEI